MQGMVRHAFGQRRKMLRSSLKSLGADVDLGALFADSGVAPDVRAEAVDVEGFCALARAWADQRK
jgi:16S rRNA (adenine1518-N6/adenine1519-N6)-dimethyltransferase